MSKRKREKKKAKAQRHAPEPAAVGSEGVKAAPAAEIPQWDPPAHLQTASPQWHRLYEAIARSLQ